MDPSRIFKSHPNGEEEGRGGSASGGPASSSSSSSSFRRQYIWQQPIRSSGSSKDPCSYWSVQGVSCLNGKCREETQRFRQCGNNPREIAVPDEDAPDKVQWRPAAEVLGQHGGANDDEHNNMFSDLALVMPRSFRELGGATDDLIAEVAPEIERMQRQFEDRPWKAMGEMLDALSLPPPPFLPPGHKRGGRDVPIEDRSGDSTTGAPIPRDNGLRNPAYPHPRDMEGNEPGNPLTNIGRSFSGWAHRITGKHDDESGKDRDKGH